MTDLLAGHVTMAFDTMPSAMPHVRAGKLKALGVSAPKRVPSLPDVPAIAEVVPGYELITWYGLLAPRGVPAPIVERLNGEVRKALESRDVADKLTQAGLDPMWSGTAEFAAMVRSDVPRMRQLIQASGAKAD
jgi:tripartite-type tricarboxylate transporter receptor subunit TctC